MKILNKLFVLCSSIGIIILLTACNTVQGVGEDMQAGGHAISKAAQESK